MILDGILVQLDGIKCDAKILDTILRRQMVLSVKQKQQQQQQQQQHESDIN